MFNIENCSFTELKKLQIVLDTEEVAERSMNAVRATLNDLTGTASNTPYKTWLNTTWACSLSSEEFAIINRDPYVTDALNITRDCCV